MLALARAGAERDKRMREQGVLVLFTDVQQVASEVFGEISSTLSKLSDLVDPNGRFRATSATWSTAAARNFSCASTTV
jgi:hypothetical protein